MTASDHGIRSIEIVQQDRTCRRAHAPQPSATLWRNGNTDGGKQRASRRAAHNLPRSQIGTQLCALLVAGLGAAAFGIADLLIGLAGALFGGFVLLSILLAFQFAMLTVGFVFTRCVVGHHLGDSVERLQTNVSAAPVMRAARRTAPVGAV
ncbi:hypothetical protein [Xanthomonas campestris]|uniref:hypothetical protein n=1 Tax=Xanthomonas campestris TaxID=339 RepID=UPI001E420281|nr:hypothetical protein [Xanthomonas campestris]MCC8691521.1 hypothetical protein [Xanthomonas campestris]MEA9707074.1 hypothetical protein [Xanthomonas campestris pv. raphani]MEA9726057.1 hypothetical protein [Xanthomonas campestris pv. raphani]MEA9751567.1 hypothetical protein [Xanthomonas campestris pv. raphani]MEA9810209.1 hypothetical protein [Xanthomonas campestris pv. raphani]